MESQMIEPNVFAARPDHEPTAARPVFDRQRTLSLCDGDPELMRDLCDVFQEIAGELVAELRRAVASADAGSVCLLAHSLRGAASNLSAGRLEATVRRVMDVGQRDALGEAPPLLDRLGNELAELERALDVFRAELETGAGRCVS